MSESNPKIMSIDPVAEGVVNRVARDTVLSGNLSCAGGLWVEGKLCGDVTVDGILVLDVGGEISGRVHVRGPRACLVGKITPREGGQLSEILVDGVAELGESLVAQANITAHGLDFYPGAQIEGQIKTAHSARGEGG